jgi:RHH-type proline utilization regulon transcriptional repressor/proline dehydrogenase/delta 1-pyrroline-5-carboxylate dehydrogenase
MTNFDMTNIQNDQWLSSTQQELHDNISSYYSVDEKQYIEQIYPLAYDDSESLKIKKIAEEIIHSVRANEDSIFFDLEDLLQEYSLSDEDGVTLMCLAEALLRIPDAATVDALIQDKLSDKEWSRHFSKDNSLFVNASTWGLAVAGGLVNVNNSSISRFFKNSTKPVIRAAVDRAMRIMGQHFVLGRTVDEAMKNAKKYIQEGYDYSYDMLGESAITQADADRYYESYMSAIKKIAANTHDKKQQPSLSIKLSALHPRFEETHRDRVLIELGARVEKMVLSGIEHNVGITIDAEEADRMELTLAIFELIYSKSFVRGWEKFGLVVQAYSKRALPALCWLTKLAKEYGDEVPIRLVKGAYWDSEIQHSQVMGLSDYPVFTRKEYTDTAYLACARFLLSDVTKGAIYPQFASHNAHTVSSIKVMAPIGRDFEFQRLHGMGDDLYSSVLKTTENINVRIYAPVGSHEDLLPYLVRRLLENGANSSFVHQLSDERTDIADLIKRPLTLKEIKTPGVKGLIPKPLNIFVGRKNSMGVNLSSSNTRQKFMREVEQFKNTQWSAQPIIDGKKIYEGATKKIVSPYDNTKNVGEYREADKSCAISAIAAADKGFRAWATTPVEQRCEILEVLAEKMESNLAEMIALCQREAGKTIQDAIDEVREAVDFCTYYAQQARKNFVTPITLQGPTGESNQLLFEPRGVFVCISPWNYPLAIFTGQIVAALVAGNTVIAKPAETTSLVAYKVVELLFESGLPASALQFLPGPGGVLGAVLNADNRVSGVVFTGSNATARIINQTLAARDENAGIATLIAETGGLNAMIVDSTALPEQVARDVVHSAFSAAGQRCSALRILYVQEDIAPRVLDLIKGMMEEFAVGDPQLLSTDMGPVIDSAAAQKLHTYIDQMKATDKPCFQVDLSTYCAGGTFIKPTVIEIDSITSMTEEQFGPILHVVRFKAKNLDQVISDINSKGYGLTLGVHTRNKTLYEKITAMVSVGNVYINRNQVGAVVGVNPFGGRGLSGTGPKAGGPHYLLRFATEKTISNNVSAIGGNIELLNATSS